MTACVTKRFDTLKPIERVTEFFVRVLPGNKLNKLIKRAERNQFHKHPYRIIVRWITGYKIICIASTFTSIYFCLYVI